MRPDDVAAAQLQSFETFREQNHRLGDPVGELTDDVRERGQLRVDHLRSTDPSGAWVAEQDGELVGVAMAIRRSRLWYLSLLTVSPALQGRGLGRRLLDAALGTYTDAEAGLIMASPDPRALRRYARAGFLPHPGYDAHGVVDRSALPADLGVRAADLARDAGLLERHVSALRGAPHGPDVDVLVRTGAQLWVDDRERGFALLGGPRVLSVGADSPEVAQRLLWAALAQTTGAVDVAFVTADQLWAVPVLVAAGLALAPRSSSCRRGALGPLAPYLPTGAYG